MTEHKISWLNMPGYKPETWNPIIGCSKVSTGCDNCYAEKFAFRIVNMLEKSKSETYHVYQNAANKQGWTGRTALNTDHIDKPMKWKDKRMVLVCSMGDLFHENVPFEWIDAVFSVMSDNDQHIYILLTKRPHKVEAFFDWKKNNLGFDWAPKDNIWFGVTIENQEQANKRLPYLNYFYAAVKFVSVEPMLSAIDFSESIGETLKWHAGGLKNCISWVICGGESGNKARPMHPDWVRFLRDQCRLAEVPFFFKQWGEWGIVSGLGNQKGKICFNSSGREQWLPSHFGYSVMKKIGRNAAGNLLDGEQHHNWPKL